MAYDGLQVKQGIESAAEELVQAMALGARADEKRAEYDRVAAARTSAVDLALRTLVQRQEAASTENVMSLAETYTYYILTGQFRLEDGRQFSDPFISVARREPPIPG